MTSLGPETLFAAAMIAIGMMLMVCYIDEVHRSLGAGFALAGAFVWTAPAHADQTLSVEDNAGVECAASAHDLTRISLVGDAFASVSKVQAASPEDDFNVVNEPTRGDIYVGVPEGFKRRTFSFFGTTRKGFVYKFSCRVEAIDAQQIFLTNPQVTALAQEQTRPEDSDGIAPDQDETAIRLVQAMATQRIVPGFRMERTALVPVKSGALNVQMVAEYTGLDLVGRVVRVENAGPRPVELTEEMVAPADAVAVSIGNPHLAARQVTAVYVVLDKRSAR